MISNFLIFIVSLYFLSWIFLATYWKTLNYSLLRASRWALSFSVIAHWGDILSGIASQSSLFPQSSRESLLVITAFVGAILWLISFRKALLVILLFALPLMIASLFGLWMLGSEQESTASFSPWLWSHILLTVLGEAFFFIAALISAVFLVVDKTLKKMTHGFSWARLPSLNELDQILWKVLMSGFVLMTMGLGMGFFFANLEWSKNWILDPKVLMAVVTWAFYALMILARAMWPAFHGRWLARSALIGLGVVLILSFGLDWTGRSRHPFISSDSSNTSESD